MNPTSAPGVTIDIVEPRPDASPVRADTAGFVVVCERGPIGVAVPVTSWASFTATFGEFVPNGLGAYALKAFFDNGGRHALVVRVAAVESVTALDTGAVQPADRRSSVLVGLTGVVAGAAATLDDGSLRVTRLVTAIDPPTRTVTWDRPLHPDLAIAAGPAVSVGRGTAMGTLHSPAGAAVITVRASTPGAWGNRLTVTTAPGRRAATTSRIDDVSSPVAIAVRSTDGFAARSAITVSQPDGVGGVRRERAIIGRVDRAERVLWLEAPLAGPFTYTGALNIESSSVTLAVAERGRVGEVHPDLTFVPGHARFAATILEQSRVVRATVVGGPLADDPALGQTALLDGGRDGTAGLRVDDLLGSWGTDTGLAVLDDTDEPGVVAIPDLVGEPTPPVVTDPVRPDTDPCLPCQPPAAPPLAFAGAVVEASARFTGEEIAIAQRATVEHCERHGDRVALLDPPDGPGPSDPAAVREWAGAFDSSFAACYTPWLQVVDPLRGPAAAARLRRVPPSGHVAGLIGRVDAEVGPWRSPANRALAWAHRTDAVIGDAAHATFNGRGINAIRSLPGRGLVVCGARTLSADTSVVFLNVRRLMIYVRRVLRASLAWTAFEPADAVLDGLVGLQLTGLGEDLWLDGALAGDTAAEAFIVRTGLGDRANGELVAELGVAAARPAEFIVVRVERTVERLELREHPERSRP